MVRSLGTEEFTRVRLGVGPERVWGDLADYVLSPLARAEREIAQQMAAEAADAVEMILTDGVGKAMTRFNRRVPGSQEDLQ